MTAYPSAASLEDAVQEEERLTLQIQAKERKLKRIGHQIKMVRRLLDQVALMIEQMRDLFKVKKLCVQILDAEVRYLAKERGLRGCERIIETAGGAVVRRILVSALDGKNIVKLALCQLENNESIFEGELKSLRAVRERVYVELAALRAKRANLYRHRVYLQMYVESKDVFELTGAS